jgi:hypothetical protein
LCWQTVEKQFIPALAIASAVTANSVAEFQTYKTNMKLRLIFYIFLTFSISLSCTRSNENDITKFLFIKGIELSYDSLGKPQLGIVKYLEYSPNDKVKLALGKRFNNYPDYEKAPAFSLTEFYEFQKLDSLETIINNTFSGKNYDSIYTKEITEGQYYNFFIWETSSRIKKEILYYAGTLPGELDSLDRYLNRLFVTQRKVKTERFNVNPLVIELQSRLFKKFPPPPISVDSVPEENTDSNH